jgi:general stress protein YciG
VREIAAMGGRANANTSGSAAVAEPTDHSLRSADAESGGAHSANPGNFANRPKEEVRDAARKGGLSS